jgi:hypothetical protein
VKPLYLIKLPDSQAQQREVFGGSPSGVWRGYQVRVFTYARPLARELRTRFAMTKAILSRRREYPDGVYSVRQARAGLKEVLERIARGEAVVIVSSPSNSGAKVAVVLGAVPLPDATRVALEAAGIADASAPVLRKGRSVHSQRGPAASAVTAVPRDIAIAFGAGEGDQVVRAPRTISARRSSIADPGDYEVGEVPHGEGGVRPSRKAGARGVRNVCEHGAGVGLCKHRGCPNGSKGRRL